MTTAPPGRIGCVEFQCPSSLGEPRGRTREPEVVPAQYRLGIVRFERVIGEYASPTVFARECQATVPRQGLRRRG